MKYTILVLLALAGVSAFGQVKNEQTVLGGQLIRAGNAHQAQLNDTQLQELCSRGVSQAYFLYSGATPRTVSCGNGKTISYQSQSINDPKPIMAKLAEGHKVFVHCNNGAHASGLIAAIALEQFCGYSPDQAFSYFQKTMGGYALPASNQSALLRRMQNYAAQRSDMGGKVSCGN